ncbi:hypothetical protein B0H15DRAFT_864302 [Mycena belliarum]|uniref:DUF7729 domain-containing protein n=1 Tax=Mycena belliarum TaxID=1033014 RepID=A0AAD6TW05_9AGAR|nr:hypothetical protein B0H15DRAFT_864302 [Mycena belliae]
MKAGTLISFAAAAGLASAQSLSSGCTDSLKGILNAPEAACLNPSALLTFIVGTSDPIRVVDNWLTGLCSAGSCSNATLATVVTNITTGCASELSSASTAGVPETLTRIVQDVYPTVRSVVCLKDDASNKLCVTEALQNIQGVVGTLSASDFNLATLTADFQKVIASASNLACTKCTKVAFSMAKPLLAQFQMQAVQGLDAVCGPGFTDGSLDGVSQTANTGIFTTKPNNALALTSKMAGVMVVLLSAFTLLG